MNITKNYIFQIEKTMCQNQRDACNITDAELIEKASTKTGNPKRMMTLHHDI